MLSFTHVSPSQVSLGSTTCYKKSFCSMFIAFASRTKKCRNPKFGGAAHSLSGTPHWCLQDYMEVNQESNMFLIPSGCSLLVKEVDDMPTEDIDVINRIAMKKLSEVSLRQQYVRGGGSSVRKSAGRVWKVSTQTATTFVPLKLKLN